MVHQQGWHEVYEDDEEEWDEEGGADEDDEGVEDDEEQWDESNDDEDEEEDEEEWDEEEGGDDEEWEERRRGNDPGGGVSSQCRYRLDFCGGTLLYIEEMASTHILDDRCIIVNKGDVLLTTRYPDSDCIHGRSSRHRYRCVCLSTTQIAISQWDEDSNSVHVLSIDSPYDVLKLRGIPNMITDMKGLPNGRAVTTSFDTTIIWDP